MNNFSDNDSEISKVTSSDINYEISGNPCTEFEWILYLIAYAC